MSNEHRNAIAPPRPVVKTPPACEEAKRIARGEDKDFRDFQERLQRKIDENRPTWKQVVKGLFRKGQ